MAAPKKRPPREWKPFDLMDLGARGGEKTQFLKAVPVIILEEWVQGGREEGVANYVWTKSVAGRLVDSGLHAPFKPKGTSTVISALTAIQGARNLTRPILIESLGGGEFKINLPYYEELLQDYRQEYSECYEEDYRKLFPKAEDEPDWGWPIAQAKPVEPAKGEPIPPAPQEQSDTDIDVLLTQLQDAIYGRQQELETLKRKNEKLQAEMDTLKAREWVIIDDELRNDCAELLQKEKHYIHAIRSTGPILELRLKNTIGGDGQEKHLEGVRLVDYALDPDKGMLVISDHPAEQAGVQYLFRGAIQFVRNPPAHKKIQYTKKEIWYAMNLIDYLLSLLGQARLRED
jgi:uncharacterized protein (TIGR02391 family)